jgi:hypothetical protein
MHGRYMLILAGEAPQGWDSWGLCRLCPCAGRHAATQVLYSLKHDQPCEGVAQNARAVEGKSRDVTPAGRSE